MIVKPLVSGIIIFLNEEKFIQEAIESVLAQSYDNWELLLVDDGSTDRGTEMALQYAEQYPERIRYLEHSAHQNLGKSVSRNLGIENAKGEYVAFLDADDVWLSHKLEQQVAILNSRPEAAMVYGHAQYWYSWTGRPQDMKRDRMTKLGVQPDTLVMPPTLLTLLLQNESMRKETICPYPCSVLVRREVFKDIGGFEETFQDLYDDVVFFAKVFSKAPVFVASGCWGRYRLYPDNGLSKSYSNAIKTGQWHHYQSNPAELTFLNWLQNYLSEQDVKDNKVWNAFKKVLLPYHHPILYRPLRYVQHFVRYMKKRVKLLGRRMLPFQVVNWLAAIYQNRKFRPVVGWVRFGSLRRVTPISRVFGFDRGLPIDRYYIENFLSRHADHIRGHVLEIGDDYYTWKFGGNRVNIGDVLHVVPGNEKATIVGDLSRANHISSDAFDCIILTQTLYCIYDLQAAIKTIYRILKPGAVVLTTLPGICQIARPDMELWGDYWRFTTLSARRLFELVFPPANIDVESHGNVLVAISFLHGLALKELRKKELDYHDPDYQVSITVRAVKPEVR